MRIVTLTFLCGMLAACGPGAELPEDDVFEASALELTGLAARIDVVTLNCPPGGVCTPQIEQCICAAEFDRINYSNRAHLLAVGTSMHRAKILANGNQQAMYVNSMNDDEALGGAAAADRMISQLRTRFPDGLPKWMVLNELSTGGWGNRAAYRSFVIALAKRLTVTHGRSVVIAAPFERPGNHAADWAALSKVAYIAAEVYLSGAEVKAAGFSIDWAEAHYRSSVAKYGALGVPKARLMLFEHFGNTLAGTNWGRAGVSAADWKRVIQVRARAARRVGFASVLSYAWAFNQMGDSNANRLAYIDTYAAEPTSP